jgi:hypothetical protein
MLLDRPFLGIGMLGATVLLVQQFDVQVDRQYFAVLPTRLC